MMVDKKKIQETFLFKFKIGCKATSNINNAFDLETLLMDVRCSGYSKSFAKEMRALKMRRVVAVFGS